MKAFLVLSTLALLASCGRSELILQEKIGVDGKNGVDGLSLVANSGILTANAACPAGGSVTTIYQDVNRNEVVDLDTDKLVSSFVVCNGAVGQAGVNGLNGSDGHNGTNGSNSILQVIDLRHDVCGLSSQNFSEVIIKLADGRYLSSFSDNVNGDNTRFSILVQGVTYQTTDGNNCRFTINAQNNIVRL